jgi:hypothetical protein
MTEELVLTDRGNVRPDSDELVSQELLNYLDSTNRELGTELDPRFDEFNRFINSIDETAILRIEPEGMSTGKFNDLDLTGNSSAKDIKEPANSIFFGKGSEKDEKLLEILEKMMWVLPISQGEVIDKDYAPIIKWFTLLDIKE